MDWREDGASVCFTGPCDPEELGIVDILRRAFPGILVGDLQVQYEYDLEELSPSYKGQIHIQTDAPIGALDGLLGLLTRHITVVDSTDECHALAMHSYPDPDPEINAFHRTKIGALVNRAKPYNLWSGDLDEAKRLAGYLEEFIANHPTYRRASWLFAAPPSNKEKKFDLPSVLSSTIAADLGIRAGHCVSMREVEPQKDIGDIEELRANRWNSVRIDHALDGQTVILLDDIYRSGQTLGDMTRAARSAGASVVLGLAATKTMKFAQGLSL